MKLKNVKFANAVSVSSFGVLKFDNKGYVIEPKLDEEALKALAEIKGFELIEEAVQPKIEEKSEEPKEEVKEPENEAEEPQEEDKPKRKRRKTE